MGTDSERSPSKPKLVVGIGASAGGLEACQRFLAEMPADTGMAIIIVMHLDPTYESRIAEIFSRSTRLPVVQVQESQAIQLDHVYVIAPDTSLELRDGILHPNKPNDPHGQRKPIDAFFSSLGQDQGELAVAIILSGTGNNGSSALAGFKAAGGLCLAQEPETADYDGMPQSAIATGEVDHILAPEEMPRFLLEYMDHQGAPRLDDASSEALEAFDVILELLSRTYRVNFRGAYKRGTLKRRTERRMGLKQVSNWKQYLELLTDSQELALLYRDLLIGVTQFFRDPKIWRYLETQILPSLLARNTGGAPFKIWIPGCATGEEAYSLAIVVLEQFERLGQSTKLQIFASDIAETALASARRGVYPSTIRESVSQERLTRFFRPKGEGFEICPEVRESVTFAVHNLLADPPFSSLDMVSCRNVLIYFENHAQQKALELFHFALKPGGLLLLGGSETVGQLGNLFETISQPMRVYRSTATAETARHLHWVAERAFHGVGGTQALGPKSPKVSRIIEQIILSRYTWACVAVTESFEIQSFFGPTQEYLVQPTGEARMDLLAWAKPGIYPRLRMGLEKARNGKERVKISDMRMERDGAIHRIECTIEPFTPIPGEARVFLVSFRDIPGAPTAIDDLSAAEQGEPLVRQLEIELKDTREELQSTIEELESTNEEYRASREELMSLNEELQSNNEELQASKEELQSLNEEMVTINRQLENKNVELRQVSTDLQNLLVSANIPIIFLDRDFRVRRFTPAATELMRLVPSDLGRSIEHIKERFHNGGLLGDAQEVLAKLVPIVTEVQTENHRWYTRAMRPYRTEDDRIDGVCIAFFDISNLKQAAQQHEEARRSVEAIVAESPAALLVLDAELRVVTATQSFCKLFHVTKAETEGSHFSALGSRQWDILPLRELLEKILPEKAELRDYEVTLNFDEIGRRTLRIQAHQMSRGDLPAHILLSIEDLTERRTAEEVLKVRAAELAQEYERKNDFLAMLGHELRNPIAALTHGLDLLALVQEDPARREELRGMMMRQTKRIVSMMDQLLDLARVSSGKIRMVREAVDLAQAVRGAIETVAPLLESRKHQLSISLPTDKERAAMVEGDPTRLAQIVENLLSNAAKYSEEGGKIAIELEADERWVRLHVRDTGIGMEANLLPHVFELFTQGPRGLDRSAGGLGLGLPLVKRLVEMHGGRVEASSHGYGHGSEFVVTLPRLIERPAKKEISDTRGAPVPPALRRHRILIVDDEQDMARILAEILEAKGHQALAVHDGPAALIALPSFAPEVVLLDLGLPDMDGYEVAKRMREAPRGKELLVIALTGYQRDKARLEQAGVDQHLIKPLDLQKLGVMLAAWDRVQGEPTHAPGGAGRLG